MSIVDTGPFESQNQLVASQQMNPHYKETLMNLLFQLADDDLVFGHRSSEWLGLAPDLEEDIAFSSIAQDEVGHAAFFYGLLAELTGESSDSLAFSRLAQVRRNARLLEQPNGDWAYTITRAFFYNVFEQVRLEALLESNYLPIRQGAAKILREERYHRLHMETWFERLAVAGGEAQRRLEDAIKAVWADLPDLFSLGQDKDAMVAEGVLPQSASDIYSTWEASVKPMFERTGLAWPGEGMLAEKDGRLGQHTDHLGELLRTMTEVYTSDVDAKW